MSTQIQKLTLALGLFALAAALVYTNRPGPSPMPNRVRFVCVETGQLFTFSQYELPSVLPARHPTTKRRTLLPIVARATELQLNPRYADLLRTSELRGVNHYVNPDTLAVRRAR